MNYIIYAEGQFGNELTAGWLRRELKKAGGKDVQINLNSPGGSPFEAAAMMDVLKTYKGRKVIRIVSLAASAASRFCTAADEIVATSNSAHLRHCASGGTYGNSADHEKTLTILRGIDKQMAADYSKWSGKSIEQELAEMEAEAWTWGEEIYEQGYATSFEKVEQKQDPAVAMADARSRFAAAFRAPTESEVAAYLGSTSPDDRISRLRSWVEADPGNIELQALVEEAIRTGQSEADIMQQLKAAVMNGAPALDAEDLEAARIVGLSPREYKKALTDGKRLGIL